jgi:hypothetical protein
MLLLGKILLILLAVFLIIWMVRVMRSNPTMFSGENWSKSFFSMGILALILIAFVALAVIWVRLS